MSGLPAGAAVAQDTTTAPPSYWLAGASLGMPGSEGDFAPELMTIGTHLTRARPGRLGPDFSIGTMPYALAAGMAVVGVRAGLVLPLRVGPGVMLLPSGGLSFVGVSTGMGAGALAGFNLGGSAIFESPGPVGMRAGITWHRFQESRTGIWLVELGIVRSLGQSS